MRVRDAFDTPFENLVARLASYPSWFLFLFRKGFASATSAPE